MKTLQFLTPCTHNKYFLFSLFSENMIYSNSTINMVWPVECQNRRLAFQLSSIEQHTFHSMLLQLATPQSLDIRSLQDPISLQVKFYALILLPFYGAISHLSSEIKIKSQLLSKAFLDSNRQLLVMSTVLQSTEVDIGTVYGNMLYCNLHAQIICFFYSVGLWMADATLYFSLYPHSF